MFLVKVLENKGVIRFFGISLILAPFINNLTKLSLLTTVPNRWTFPIFWQVVQTSAVSTQVLSIAGIFVGALMLNGSQKAWRYALFLMGTHIIIQLINFGPAYRTSKISLLFLLINVGVFLFIADQLVWKVKAKGPSKKMVDEKPWQLLKEALAKNEPIPGRGALTKAPASTATPPSTPTPFPYRKPDPQPIVKIETESKAPTEPFNPVRVQDNVVELKPTMAQAAPTSVANPSAPVQESQPVPRITAKSERSIPVQFEGFGSWAKLSKITPQGIHMHSLTELPFEFGSRQIAVQFASGMNLRIRFSKREGQDFFFEFVDLSKDQVREINAWLKRVA